MRRGFRGGVVRLRFLMQSGHWPSGNPRLYLRRKGQPRVPMPDQPPDSPAFLAAYSAALGARHDPVIPPATGSIAAGITAFLASDHFLSKAPATRAYWRRGADAIRKAYGTGQRADLAARHIKADLAKLSGHAAVRRWKVWRAVCTFWDDAGLIDTDPARQVRKPRTPKEVGHIAWTMPEVNRFRAFWPVESRERLAMELILWTGARMSDAVRLSPSMVGDDGWIAYRQQKTGGEVAVPFTAPAPDWAAQDSYLAHALQARPDRHMVFMVTAYGAPRSVKAASAWFAAATRKAGIEGRSAHGLRKTRANIMTERGATTDQRGAWLGHESLDEVQHYSADARKRVIISGTFDESANSDEVGTGT